MCVWIDNFWLKADMINVKIPIARFFTNKKSSNNIFPQKIFLQPITKLQVMVFWFIKGNPWKITLNQFFGNRAEKKSEASNQKSTLVCTWGSVWGLEQNFWIKQIFWSLKTYNVNGFSQFSMKISKISSKIHRFRFFFFKKWFLTILYLKT